MLETLFCCILLITFVFACVEIANIIADKTHLQRVVREAAKETVVDMKASEGRKRGQEAVSYTHLDSIDHTGKQRKRSVVGFFRQSFPG